MVAGKLPKDPRHQRFAKINGPLRQALAEETLDLALLWQTEEQGPRLGRCPLLATIRTCGWWRVNCPRIPGISDSPKSSCMPR
jgi:hypothetical protein